MALRFWLLVHYTSLKKEGRQKTEPLDYRSGHGTSVVRIQEDLARGGASSATRPVSRRRAGRGGARSSGLFADVKTAVFGSLKELQLTAHQSQGVHAACLGIGENQNITAGDFWLARP